MEDGDILVSEITSPLLPRDTAQQDGLQSIEDGPLVAEADVGAQPTRSAATTPWQLTTAVMLGDMFGLGALSVPANFARLGWIPASTLVALLSVGGWYAGLLYTRLALAVPTAKMFDQVGERACGKVGKYLVYGSIYLTILAEPVIFHLTSVESLIKIFESFQLAKWQASIIVTALIVPLAQVQHMEDVGWISIMGTVGMLTSVFVVLAKLLATFLGDTAPRPPTQLVSTAPLPVMLVGVMDLVFTYGGQVNWMRYITTMRTPSRFKDAVSVTTVSMSSVYVLLGVAGYATLGSSIDINVPITSIMAADHWAVLMNAGLFLHCVLAYQINLNVWAACILHVVSPATEEAHKHGGVASNFVWAAVTTAGVAYAALFSFYFPFFSIVMAIIASLGDLASMFGLPCLFSLWLLELHAVERGLCWVLVVVSLLLSSTGVVSSVWQLVDAFQHSHKS